MTKDDVLAVFKKYFLPLFDSESSVAVVVTAPSKADQIGESLQTAGFQVDKRTLEVDPSELEGSESESESESDEED